MKDNAKIIVLSVIVMILALATFYYLKMSKPVMNTTSSVTPVVQPVVTSNNTTDTQLDQDINTVDSNLSNLNAQSASVDSSMNQKQVDPSQ